MQSWKLSGVDALSQIREGSLTVEAYARSLLERILERDENVHAWVFLDTDLAIRSAKELDRVPMHARGPIHGLPIGVKDVMLTHDMPTQYNSRLYESSTPINTDAAPVATLRASGALIFGKLATTEFATTPQGNWHQNYTSNACDSTRTPGGSSSGSGAAVADFQVPIALGTQTGGSIIRPASFNGCFGWKPTWGIISREGLAQWCITLDTCGFFARSIADLELMADVFHLEESNKGATRQATLAGTRIAFCRTHNWHKAEIGTQNAMEAARHLLDAEGAECQDLTLPDDFAMVTRWHSNILAGEGKAAFLHHYLKDRTLLHEQIRSYVESGSVDNRDLCEAYDGCARLRSVWDGIAGQYDAVVVPSVPDEAPNGLGHTGDMSLCSMWTALHVPAINVPGFVGGHSLPIGLTLVSGRYEDRALLGMARMVAQAFENRR